MLKILLTPSIWFRNYPINLGWSHRLDTLMDNNIKIVLLDSYTAEFEDGTSIWIANYPYAYGSNAKNAGYLPTRKTTLKLAEYIGLHAN